MLPLTLSQQRLHLQTFTAETEPIGLLAGALRSRIRTLVEARAEPYGLSALQFWMFVAVVELPEPSLADVAARVRSDLPTASRAMKELFVRGMVIDDRPASNRRRSRFLLTPRGRRVKPRLLALAQEVRRSVEEGLTPGERRAVRYGLRKAITHVENLLHQEGLPLPAASSG
jgi:DNA-binding MarR family transcriptional regulator